MARRNTMADKRLKDRIDPDEVVARVFGDNEPPSRFSSKPKKEEFGFIMEHPDFKAGGGGSAGHN